MLTPVPGKATSSLSFTWTKSAAFGSPSNIWGYVVHLRTKGANWPSDTHSIQLPDGAAIPSVSFSEFSPWRVIEAAHNMIAFTGLQPGTTYEARVHAVEFDGANSAWSATAQSATEAAAETPGAPQSVTATTGNTELLVAWAAPASGGAVANYRVRWKLASATNFASGDATTTGSGATSATITGLTNGSAYDVEVAAGNSNGFGTAVTVQATPSVVAPDAPQSAAAAHGDSELRVSWAAPARNGGAAISNYRVRWKLASATNFAPADAATVGATTLARTITGLTNGSAYDVEIAAQNSVGFGTAATVQGTPLGPPGAPQSPSVTPGDGRLTLSWTRPADNGGAGISGFRLRWKLASATTFDPADTRTGISFTQRLITGLTNGETYDVEISLRNSEGFGAAVTLQATLSSGPPGAPQSPTATPVNAGLQVAWSAPASNGGLAITNYRLRWKLASAANFASGDTRTVGASVTSATITGLANGSRYDVEIAAQNSAGFGAAATVQGAPKPVAPSAPQNPTATSGNGELQIAWSAPADNGGAAITNYRVRWKLASATTFASGDTATVGATTLARTITGLTNRSAYDVEIAAQNSVGFGAAATLQSTPGTPPGAPQNPTATPGNARLQVAWTAPADNGGAAITNYRLRWKLASAAAFAPGDTRTVGAVTSATITGLTNGSRYDVEIAAQNSAGFGAVATAQGTPRTTPGGLLSFGVTPENTRLEVSWSAPGNNGGSPITGYRMRWKLVSAAAFAPADTRTFDAFTTFATITGLTNGSRYNVEVAARNAVGFGPATTAQGTPRTVPGAPQNPSATPGDGELQIAWSAPASNGGAVITNYRLRWKLASAAAFAGGDTRTVGASVTSATITGLAGGKTYDVQITARNFAGFGAAATVQGTPPAVPPGAPQNPTATPGNTELQIAWRAPADNGGAAITNYRLRWKLASAAAFASGDTATVGATTLARTITGLTNGSAYDVEITAQNSAGFGAAATTQGTPDLAPGAPQNPAATPGNTQLRVSWAAPADNGGPAITNYRLRWKLAGAAAFAPGDTRTVGASATSATITGLTNGETYDVEIAAQNAAGFGAAATAQSTPRTVPGAPRSPGVTIADGELQLTWSAPANNGGAAITDYRLRWKLATAIAFASGDARAVGTATSATITGLTNGSAYDVEIAAQNAAGFGAASAFQAIPRAAAGVPGVPQSVRLVSNTRQSLRLAWEPPLDNGGAAISGYRLSLRGGGSSSVAATARSFTLQNLTPGTLYTVTLSARNSVGTGPVAVVQGVPGGATAPQSAAATPGDGELRVAWSAPDNNGGATITGYRLRWKLASAAAFAGGDTRTVGAVTSATITGLTNGEAYDVEITAQTSRGFGAPATVQSTPGLTPSAPQSATATPGNAELQIAWSAPADNGGSAILTYRLRWKLASAAAFAAGDVIRVGADTTTATITGLTNGETYEVEIAAQNSDGFGAAAILQSTLPTPPGAPQNPTATPGNTELQIAWSAPADAADAAILTYRLRWKDADDASFASGDVILTGADTTTATITGLTNRETYDVEIAAGNSEGLGAAATLQGAPADTPGAPTSVATTPGIAAFRVTWAPPDDTGGADVLSYQLRWKLQAATTFAATDAATIGAAARAHDIGGLQKCGIYEAQIAAQTSAGLGAYSAAARAVLFDLDVDANGRITASDGLLAARHVFGVTGAALTNGLADAADTAAITERIQCGADVEALDVDADGGIDHVDGILVARYVLGLRGDELVASFGDLDADEVAAKIAALLPAAE
ncbi:MAG: fibronectin type III domain-containing protein [Gammaproteobacteria bacterium]|nr:fibronectin type III domain-containing protein [Gammaproteobacteria bacterium]